MKNQKDNFILLLLILFALSLRLVLLTQKNLWFDEIYSWHISLGNLNEIIKDTSADIHPPFYYFTLKMWNIYFSDSVLSMRLFSVIFSTFAILFIFGLSKRILNIQNTFFVILLYAVSPLNIFYSQEVRMSALNLFLNLGSVYYLIKLIDKGLSPRTLYKNIYSYLFIVFSVLTLYTHYFSIPIFISLVIFILYYFRNNLIRTTPYLILFFIVALIYIPWVPTMLSQGTRGQPWREPQSTVMIIREIVNYIRDLSLGLYYSDINIIVLRILTVMISIIIIYSIIGIILRLKKISNQNGNKYVYLPLFITLISIITAIVVSINQRIEFFRYLSIIIPFIIILMIYGMDNFTKKYFLIVFILFMSINIYGTFLYYSKDFKNNDYRSVINIISQNHKEGDKILVEPHYYSWILDYYIDENDINIEKPMQYGWKYEMVLDSLNKYEPEYFWLITDYSSLDTTYFINLNKGISKKYKNIYESKFDIIPNKVNLYYYQKLSTSNE